jgi:hypothetical protein
MRVQGETQAVSTCCALREVHDDPSKWVKERRRGRWIANLSADLVTQPLVAVWL